MLKKLLSCVGKYKIYALLSPLLVACEVFLEVLLPKLMSGIINHGLNWATDPDPVASVTDAGSATLYVAKIGALMVVAALISLTFGALCGRTASVASTGFAANIRQRLFHKIQDFSFANVDKFSTASLVTRMTTDVTFVQNAFMMIIRMLVRSPIMLVSATVMAFSIDSGISMIFIVAIPVLGAAIALISSKAFKRFEEMFKKYDGMNASVQSDLIAIRVIKAFVRRDYENRKFKTTAEAVQAAQVRAEKLLVLMMPIMQFATYTCMILVAYLGGNRIMSGDMLSGDLMALISYIMQILMSLLMIAMAFVNIVMARASASRIVEIFDESIDITDDKADPELKVADGSIVFDNVSFSYARDDSNLTLANVCLDIKSGETVGIIGGTGSSKSTLVQLIPRLYDVFSGRVLVGGHDVRDYKLDVLRESVAMVLQKNVLFSGTIRDNLRWGNETATDEQIEDACRDAQAHDFVMSFPAGYDTDLGQGGVNVSGGQKQRLCIARALLKDPKVLILDDSTSAVDTATDKKIRSVFSGKRKGVTTLIIAQRIASVMDADKIIVMDDGRINAVGTHDELLASNEIYKEVYDSQMNA